MKRYRGPLPNFGDELNNYIRPRIASEDLLDEGDLQSLLEHDPIFIMINYGYGAHHALWPEYSRNFPQPDCSEGEWNIVSVPSSDMARRLGGPPQSSNCNSTMLTRELDPSWLPCQPPTGNRAMGGS